MNFELTQQSLRQIDGPACQSQGDEQPSSQLFLLKKTQPLFQVPSGLVKSSSRCGMREPNAMHLSKTERVQGKQHEHFPVKLYDLLIHEGDSMIISWDKDGQSFSVHDRNRFVREIMPKYFRSTKFTSFQRQLCLYGFAKTNQPRFDLNTQPLSVSYSHEHFKIGQRNVAQSMVRYRVKSAEVRSRSLIAKLLNQNPKLSDQKLGLCPERTLTQSVTLPANTKISFLKGLPSVRQSNKGLAVQEPDHLANNKHQSINQMKALEDNYLKVMAKITPVEMPKKPEFDFKQIVEMLLDDFSEHDDCQLDGQHQKEKNLASNEEVCFLAPLEFA